MSNLLQRARALMSSKPVIMGALVIVPLATAARSAEASVGTFTFSSGAVSTTSSSGGVITGTLGASSPNFQNNPLTLFTTSPVSVSAATWQGGGISSEHLLWQGSLNPGAFLTNKSVMHVNYDFIINLTGTTHGSVAWTLTDNIGGLALNNSGTSTGGDVNGALSALVTSSLTSSWSTQLDLVWTGFSPDANFSIDVPSSSSIDLLATPEPASLSLLGLGAIGLLARRRRTSVSNKR